MKNLTETKKFLSHIFGDKIEIGLDYMQTALINPTQKLPILYLYSEKNQTGKTTFLNYICNFLEKSYFISKNDLYKMRFNHLEYNNFLVVDDLLIENDNFVNTFLFVQSLTHVIVNKPLRINELIEFNSKIVIVTNKLNNNLSEKSISINVKNKIYHVDIERLYSEIENFKEYLKTRKLKQKKSVGRYYFL